MALHVDIDSSSPAGPATSPTVAIETHGCKLNAADSQEMARDLVSAGFTISRRGDHPDVYVINSCTVTHVADRKARHALSAARRKYPEALVVATGCYAERDSETVAALAGVDLVVTNREKDGIAGRIADRLGATLTPCGEGAAVDAGLLLLGRTRASIKIQEGCDQVCAYCIVPAVRGRERSIAPADLVRQANEAARQGSKEIVLTGTQLGSYGFDLPGENLVRLRRMLRRLLDETSIPRIRVSSLQPAEIGEGLLALWTGEGAGRLCPHFHVPLQSGSDRILRLMRRRYTSEQFLESLRRIRGAVDGASVTTDTIAGFPGETDDDFEQTVAVVERSGFANVHVFPYSARPGTSAAHFKNHVPAEVRAERAARLREIGERDFRRFRQAMEGETHSVLWERDDPCDGLTSNYVRVRLDESIRAGRARVNAIEDVVLAGLAGDRMLARPVAIA